MTDPKKNPPKNSDDTNEKIEELERALQQQKEIAIRALADLENFRRRESENKKNWGSMAVADFLRKFLPSFLEVHLASAHSTDEDMKKVVEKFFTALTGAGLQKIDPQAGEMVDPDFHEVLMVAEGEAGKIVQTFEPGWRFGDIVLVAAKVSAANS